MSVELKGCPKIYRVYKTKAVITEKIDATNSCIIGFARWVYSRDEVMDELWIKGEAEKCKPEKENGMEEFKAIQALRDAGCSCQRPLLGYRPNVGPRCRLCNTVAQENKDTNSEDKDSRV